MEMELNWMVGRLIDESEEEVKSHYYDSTFENILKKLFSQ